MFCQFLTRQRIANCDQKTVLAEQWTRDLELSPGLVVLGVGNECLPPVHHSQSLIDEVEEFERR